MADRPKEPQRCEHRPRQGHRLPVERTERGELDTEASTGWGWGFSIHSKNRHLLPKTSDVHATCPSPNPQGGQLDGTKYAVPGKEAAPSPALLGFARRSGRQR